MNTADKGSVNGIVKMTSGRLTNLTRNETVSTGMGRLLKWSRSCLRRGGKVLFSRVGKRSHFSCSVVVTRRTGDSFDASDSFDSKGSKEYEQWCSVVAIERHYHSVQFVPGEGVISWFVHTD